MLTAAAIILLLILLTALYVAAEFAAVGARRSRLRRLAEDGHPFAARILPVLEDPRQLDRYIAASQVGITLSSLILGAYAQAVLAPRAAPLLIRLWALDRDTALNASAIAILIALTILSVILGELVPKAVALQYPTQTALFTVLPMQWSLRGYAWLIAVLNGSGLLVLRMFGARSTGHRHVHSPEEIALLIAESRDGGLLEPQEQVRLHRALRLGLRNAGQLMVPRARLVGIDLRTPLRDVQRIAASSPYSRLPVYQSSLDTIVGILHTKDVVLHFLERGRSGSLGSLVRPIPRVIDTMPADRLLAFLRDRRSHQAIVLNEADRVVGFITLEDVIGELLGAVPDEFKSPRLLPLRLSDGRVRLPGGLPLERARIWVEGAWPVGNQTVGAFVAEQAGGLPEPGAQITVLDLPVEVESVEDDAVTSVIVTPPYLEADDGEEDRA
ncbi:MAG TPA: hemolysin family protein [Vicinamibacterales bacterium]|nr:hemolysin family protein [Vicinamibacterales bacterium]